MPRRRSHTHVVAPLALAALVICAGCDRERRDLHVLPATAATLSSAAGPGLRESPRGAYATARGQYDEGNSYAIGQGKLLYTAYNCAGCHAQGGGGRGPALMDADWIYGAEPENVFTSIARGRPNGMPAFGTRIPEYQMWQLVAYVRSMTGLVETNARPGRNDAMQAKPSEQLADEQPPRHVGPPPKSEPQK